MSLSTLKYGARLAVAGLILVMVATAMPLFSPSVFTTARIIFSIGAVLALAGRIMERVAAPTDEPVRLKRMRRIDVWAAIMFVAAAVFMFLRNVGGTDWIAFTLAGGALTVYTSLMVPRISSKS